MSPSPVAEAFADLLPLLREAVRKRPYDVSRSDLVTLVRAMYESHRIKVGKGGVRDGLIRVAEGASSLLRLLKPRDLDSSVPRDPFFNQWLCGVIEGERPSSSALEIANALASELEDEYDGVGGPGQYLGLVTCLMNLVWIARGLADEFPGRGNVRLVSEGLREAKESKRLTGADKPYILFAARGVLVLRERRGLKSSSTATGDAVAELICVINDSGVEAPGSELECDAMSKWVSAALREPKPSEYEDAEMRLFISRLFRSCQGH